MNTIIENYYKLSNINPLLLEKKLSLLDENRDVASEFEYWISHKEYKKVDCVVVESYTAESLAKISRILDGEAAFMLLIELRENPQKALKRIEKGFKIK